MAEVVATYAADVALAMFADAATVTAVYNTAYAVVVAASVYSVREQQRKQQNAARAAYNASLRDRYVMARSATDGRQMVLGRQRVSGPIFFIQSYGSKREHVVFCVALAAHEVDAIETVYFDDQPISLDAAGNVLNIARTEQFTISAATGSYTLQADPGASVTAVVDYGSTRVPLTVAVAGRVVSVSGATAGQTGTVTISYSPAKSPYDPQDVQPNRAEMLGEIDGSLSVMLLQTAIPGSVSVIEQVDQVTYNDLTAYSSLTASPDGPNRKVVVSAGAPRQGGVVYAQYMYDRNGASGPGAISRARVRKYLGAPGQAADAGMIAALPGVWTSAHTASGIAYLVVELDYDPDTFSGGLPNVSAVVRGAKVYDPRTGQTAWSENPALLLRYAATSPLCGRLPADAVDDAATIAAANACDASATYIVNGQAYVRPIYTAGIAAKSGQRPQDVLTDLAQAMAGKWVFTDGRLRMRAGVWSTPVLTLDESWLSGGGPGGGGSIKITPRANRSDVCNAITGTFADQGRDWQVLPMPRVAAAAYIAEDGAELPLDVPMGAVTFAGQAQQVAAVQLRDARQALRVQLNCNMRAYPLEVFDNLYVSLARYGWVRKAFEVQEAGFDLSGGVRLVLKETDPSIWALGTSFAAVDPAPNTLFASPTLVPDVVGLDCDSGASTQVQQADGSVAVRVRVSWTPVSDSYVNGPGGGYELRYALATASADQWLTQRESGDAAQSYLVGVIPGAVYLVQIRAFNNLVRGAWGPVKRHQVARIVNPALGAANAAQGTADAAQGTANAAQGTANAAQTTANAAQTAANTANTALASIASDNVLSAGEKPAVMQDVAVIQGEQGGIDAQASAYGITTAKTIYDNAVAALSSYLATLTSPTAWNNLSGDTTINGATFRAKFSDVFLARQALLNAIAAQAQYLATNVGTSALQPNAATEVYVNTPSTPVTVTQVTFSPDGFSRNTQVITLSFTPQSSGMAQVYFEGRGSYTADASGPGYGMWSIQDSAGTGAYDAWKRIGSTAVPASSSAYIPISTTRTISVTGGVTYTFAVYASKFKAGDGLVIDNHQMRVEVVKR